jgi:hypothetical protein
MTVYYAVHASVPRIGLGRKMKPYLPLKKNIFKVFLHFTVITQDLTTQ